MDPPLQFPLQNGGRKTVETQAWYRSTVHTLDCEEFEAFMQHGFQTSWPNGRKYRIITGFWRHLGPSISSFCRLFPVGRKESDRDGCHHATQASQQTSRGCKKTEAFSTSGCLWIWVDQSKQKLIRMIIFCSLLFTSTWTPQLSVLWDLYINDDFPGVYFYI